MLFLLLLAGSFIPLRWKAWLGTHGPYHLKVHFVAFFICGLIGCWSVRDLSTRLRLGLALVLLALGIEASQAIVFRIRLETADLRADLTGIAGSLAISQLFWSRKFSVRRPDNSSA